MQNRPYLIIKNTNRQIMDYQLNKLNFTIIKIEIQGL